MASPKAREAFERLLTVRDREGRRVYPEARILNTETGEITAVDPAVGPSPALLVHRVCQCHRSLRSVEKGVEVWHSPQSGGAVLAGVQTCGSAWVCPVCASRIAEHRRSEVASLLAAARSEALGVCMVTLTVRHDASMDLADVLPRLLGAVRWLRSHRQFKALRKRYGMVGSVRSTELTHGAAGWHPHFHELWILDDRASWAGLRSELAALWLLALERSGLTALDAIAVNVSDASWSDGDYLAKFDHARKWDSDAELAKGVVKRGRLGNVTPFDLLRQGLFYAAGSGRYLRAWRLFVEYARATFGVHQMQWSRGLRARFGLAEAVSDDEVAARVGDEFAVPMGTLTAAQYQRVVDAEVRAELLAVATAAWADGGWSVVAEWVESLPALAVRDRRSYRRFSRGSPWLGWDDRDWAAYQVWAFDVPPAAALVALAS